METPSIKSSSLRKKAPLRKEPGPPSGPAAKRAYRRYSESEKAEFFLTLERLGSIQLAAQELGFNLSTCRAWAPPTGRTPGGKHTQAEKDGSTPCWIGWGA
jgi:hypothetical protein